MHILFHLKFCFFNFFIPCFLTFSFHVLKHIDLEYIQILQDTFQIIHMNLWLDVSTSPTDVDSPVLILPM